MKAGDEGQQRAGLCLQRARLLREAPTQQGPQEGKMELPLEEALQEAFKLGREQRATLELKKSH